MERRVKKTTGMSFFAGATVILFLAVFLLSKIKIVGELPEQSLPEPVTDVSQSDGANDILDNAVTESAAVTEESPKEPVPDPEDADNTWAMFLVNSKNPVSESYCDSIETSLVYSSWRDYYMDSRMSQYIKKMIDDASEDGVQLVVMSAYRTVKYQQDNFDRSVQDRIDNRGMTYEEAYADTLKEVQLPGYSEHNAGVAADIMSDEYSSMDDDGFENTKAFEWLSEHAADYGFILRYPDGKENITGIIYEPWHYRFVGVYYAKLLTEKKLTMEEYFEQMNWVDEDGKAVYHIPDGGQPDNNEENTEDENNEDDENA